MNPVYRAIGAFVIITVCPLSVFAQGETAVPFLLLSPSTEADGMGGTTVALPRYDPTSFVFSPAQAGLSALTTNLRLGLRPGASSIAGSAVPSDQEYSAWAVSSGLRINDFIDLPLRIGFGLGYHDIENDLGRFNVTTPEGPQAAGTFEPYETASGIVLGVGVEYFVRFGFGYTFRSVESHLSPMGTEKEMGSGTAEGNAHDYGFLLEAPIVPIVNEITGGDVSFAGGMRPFFTLSAGVGWNNIGDKLVYVDPAQADPFPRTSRAGIAVQGGFGFTEAPGWELFSIAWTREAEDLLVVRRADGTWEYQSGLGDIQFWKNTVDGRLTGNTGLRSGWQIQAGELFTYRSGAVKGSFSYTTSGYTIRLAGLLKAYARLAGDATPQWLVFMRDYIDFQYHHASITHEQPQAGGTSSSGITVLFRVLQW